MSSVSLPAPARRAPARLVPLRLVGDDRLAALAAAGNRSAFAQIYERHHQALYRYCRSMLGNDADARDTVQSTMASALRALDGEHRTITLKPWLYRIAHNEAVTLLRRRRSDSSLDAAGEIADVSRADHATRERLRELVVDLRQLPDQQRGALVMRELSGLGYDEIGIALGISAAAATRAVYDARQGLHEFAEGRAMGCDTVRELLSANDRRSLRARKVRGHLRACSACSGFQAALQRRPADLALLAPVLPAASASALLHGVFGGTASGGSSGGSAVGATTAAAKTASTLLTVKTVAVTAVAVAAGAGAVHIGARVTGADGARDSSPANERSAKAASRPSAGPASAKAAAAGSRTHTSTTRDAPGRRAPAKARGGAGMHRGAAAGPRPATPHPNPRTHANTPGRPVHASPPARQTHAPPATHAPATAHSPHAAAPSQPTHQPAAVPSQPAATPHATPIQPPPAPATPATPPGAHGSR